MPLDPKQMNSLQQQYAQLRSQGLSTTDAQAKIKSQLVSTGQFDSMKSAYNAPATGPGSTSPLPTPAAPRGPAPKTPGTPVAPAAPAPAPAVSALPAPRSPLAAPRGVRGGAYEANLTGNQQTSGNAYSANAQKIQSSPQFQGAYADATVSQRTLADRRLSGMSEDQIRQAEAKDAAWNERQRQFEAMNPVGTKEADLRTAEGAPINVAQQGRGAQAAAGQAPVGDQASQYAQALFQKNPNLTQVKFRSQLAAEFPNMTPEQRKLADNLWTQYQTMQDANQPKTPEQFLTAIQNGEFISDSSMESAAYNTALAAVVNARGITSGADAIDAGIVQNSVAYKALPVQVQADFEKALSERSKAAEVNNKVGIQKYDVSKSNAGTAATSTSVNTNVGKIDSSTPQNFTSSIMAALAARLSGMTDPSEKIKAKYDELYGSSEMKNAQKDLSDKKLAAETIQDKIDAVRQEVEQGYAGTGMTRGAIEMLIGIRTRDLNNELKAASRAYEASATVLNGLKQSATDNLNLFTKAIEESDKFTNQLLGIAQFANTVENQDEASALNRQKFEYEKSQDKAQMALQGIKIDDKMGVWEFNTATNKWSKTSGGVTGSSGSGVGSVGGRATASGIGDNDLSEVAKLLGTTEKDQMAIQSALSTAIANAKGDKALEEKKFGETIYAKAVSKLPAAQQGAMNDAVAALNEIQSLKQKAADYVKKNGSLPNMAEGGLAYVSSGKAASSEYRSLMTSVTNAQARFQRAMTGLGVSVNELKNYETSFSPVSTFGDKSASNYAERLDSVAQSLMYTRDGMLQTKLQSFAPYAINAANSQSTYSSGIGGSAAKKESAPTSTSEMKASDLTIEQIKPNLKPLVPTVIAGYKYTKHNNGSVNRVKLDAKGNEISSTNEIL